MPDQTVIRKVITPNDQILRDVFSRQRCYYIDIYQREYKWSKDNVVTLLKDIEVIFELHNRIKVTPKEIQEDVLQNFDPYFLNTYLTHYTTTNVSIVDGQQRLTTFLLIFIKLCNIIKDIEVDDSYEDKTFSSEALIALIFEKDDFGAASRFKIYNENRESTFRSLVDGQILNPQDETQQRIKDNYKAISDYYEVFLKDQSDPKKYHVNKITYYISYLLDRISLVEIKIEKQENVAMIFEVVNDRGLGLKPYEILKGKLIGNLSSEQKEKANEIWTGLQDKYFKAEIKNSTESSIDLDHFFQTYFRAKFADSEADYKKYDGKYHYEIYSNSKIRKYFSEFKNRDRLHKLIVEDIKYFADLYIYLRTTYENEYLLFNKLLDQNQQYLLIMSSIIYNDPEKDAKVDLIAKKFDQMHTIIRLLNVYDSNAFQDLIYPLSKNLRNKDMSTITSAIDQVLIEYLEKMNIIAAGRYNKAQEIFEYERFKGVSHRWLNFSKYVLMRIDHWLAKELDKPSYTSTDLLDIEERFNKNNRRRYGLHLEHIYTWHDNNIALFHSSNGGFDEQAFNQTRNLLGMVLLLKDSQNISSNNEIYRDKIKTYSQSNFIWNELMVGHMPSVDLRNLPASLNVTKIEPTATGVFPLDKVDDRRRAIYSAIESIWGGF